MPDEKHVESFTISYPMGIEDKRIKKLMHDFTEMMFNGFAHYYLIESVVITWDRVYVEVHDHVKEYAPSQYGLRSVNSLEKEEFKRVLRKLA